MKVYFLVEATIRSDSSIHPDEIRKHINEHMNLAQPNEDAREAKFKAFELGDVYFETRKDREIYSSQVMGRAAGTMTVGASVKR